MALGGWWCLCRRVRALLLSQRGDHRQALGRLLSKMEFRIPFVTRRPQSYAQFYVLYNLYTLHKFAQSLYHATSRVAATEA